MSANCGSYATRIMLLAARVSIIMLLFQSTGFGQTDYFKPAPPRKFALVIANSDYVHLEKVRSAATDGKGIAAALEKLGFEVTLVAELRHKDQLQYDVLPPFAKKIGEGDIVVVYFSGHGFSLLGDNYLSTIDSPSSLTQLDVEKFAISAQSIVSFIRERSPGLMFLILDACRTINNLSAGPDLPNDAIKKGPAAWETSKAINTIVLFASQAGTPAEGSSNETSFSKFTGSLLQYLLEVDREFGDLWKDIRSQVQIDTNDRQHPEQYNSSSADIVFNPSPLRLTQYEEAWRSALGSGRRDDIKRFANRHAMSPFAYAARQWLRDNPTNRTFTLQIDRNWIRMPTGGAPHQNQRIILPFGVERSQPGANRIDATNNKNKLKKLAQRQSTERPYPEYTKRARDIDAIERVEKKTMNPDYANELRFLLSREVLITQEIVVWDRIGGGEPTRLPRFAPIRIEGIEIDSAGEHWLRVIQPNSRQVKFYKAPTIIRQTPIEVGRLLQEIVLSPKGGLPEIMDGEPAKLAVAALRQSGRNITWVAIASPIDDEPKELDIISARITHAEYLLSNFGIDRRRITTTSDVPDVAKNNIRVRVYGY